MRSMLIFFLKPPTMKKKSTSWKSDWDSSGIHRPSSLPRSLRGWDTNIFHCVSARLVISWSMRKAANRYGSNFLPLDWNSIEFDRAYVWELYVRRKTHAKLRSISCDIVANEWNLLSASSPLSLRSTRPFISLLSLNSKKSPHEENRFFLSFFSFFKANTNSHSQLSTDLATRIEKNFSSFSFSLMFSLLFCRPCFSTRLRSSLD